MHGTTVNSIPNLYGITNRAARDVLLDVDPKETQRIVQLHQIFNSVYDYPCPSDVKGDRIIDIRLQAGREPQDVFTQGYSLNFDANTSVNFSNKLYTQWNTGVKTLRIQAPELIAPITLTDTSSITGWTTTNDANNITLDTTNYVAGGGAIVFDLDGSNTSGTIQVSSLNAVDVTGHVYIDNEFYWVYLPNASGITSLTLTWGSDLTSNYYSYTSTTTQQGNAFQNGWNLITAPWPSATKTGSPVSTAYDSVSLTVNYDGIAQTGLKFCNLTSNTGSYFDAVYYSKFMFRDPSTNAFQETVTDAIIDSTKILNLDTESYDLMFYKLADLVAQSLQGADADYDATYFQNKYAQALVRYRAQNPSETMLKGERYYKPGDKNYGSINLGGPFIH